MKDLIPKGPIFQKYPRFKAPVSGVRGALYQFYYDVSPEPPLQGPPLPRGLGISWRGRVRGAMPGWLVKTSIRGFSQVEEAIGDIILGEKPTFRNPWRWFR